MLSYLPVVTVARFSRLHEDANKHTMMLAKSVKTAIMILRILIF